MHVTKALALVIFECERYTCFKFAGSRMMIAGRIITVVAEQCKKTYRQQKDSENMILSCRCEPQKWSSQKKRSWKQREDTAVWYTELHWISVEAKKDSFWADYITKESWSVWKQEPHRHFHILSPAPPFHSNLLLLINCMAQDTWAKCTDIDIIRRPVRQPSIGLEETLYLVLMEWFVQNNRHLVSTLHIDNRNFHTCALNSKSIGPRQRFCIDKCRTTNTHALHTKVPMET